MSNTRDKVLAAWANGAKRAANKVTGPTSTLLSKTMKLSRQAKKQDKDSVNKIVDKFYPAATHGYESYDKNRKVAKKLYKEGKVKAAVEYGKAREAERRQNMNDRYNESLERSRQKTKELLNK